MAKGVDLPNLWLPTFKGKAYAYYRANRTAKPVRIVAADGTHPLPGDPLFLDAYQALHRTSVPELKRVAAGSVEALVRSYKADERWHELALATRVRYEQMLKRLLAYCGTASVAALDRPTVLVFRRHFSQPDKNGRPTAPAMANNMVVLLGVLIRHAIDLGWRADNPCDQPRRLKTGPGHAQWKPADFEKFMTHPEISDALKRAVVVAYYTGLRVGDLIALRAVDRQDGCILNTPSKTRHSTGAIVRVPEHPELTRWLDAAPITGAATLLTAPDGRPWKLTTIQQHMTRAVRMIGLHGLSFHGLRKALTSNLAEHGATDAEIEAVIPHADPKLTRYYRRQADQSRLAETGIARLSDRKRA